MTTDTIQDFDAELRARREKAAQRDATIASKLHELRDARSSLDALEERLAAREAIAKGRRETGKNLHAEIDAAREACAQMLHKSEQTTLRDPACYTSRANLPSSARRLAELQALATAWPLVQKLDADAVSVLKGEVKEARARAKRIETELAELES